MTKTMLISYAALLCMAVAMVGVTTASASEVTGTLSSDTSNNTQTNGSIGGTVSSESSGSSGGSGGGGRSSGNNSSNSPSGSVLGASTSNPLTPSFPNAGVSPEESSIDHGVWSSVMTLLRDWFSS